MAITNQQKLVTDAIKAKSLLEIHLAPRIREQALYTVTFQSTTNQVTINEAINWNNIHPPDNHIQVPDPITPIRELKICLDYIRETFTLSVAMMQI